MSFKYRLGHSPPRFKVPLSRSILNDPAFSPDPRSHPHFPLANASSYKSVPPSHSPGVSPPSSTASSDSLSSFSSPTVSSATSPSPSPSSVSLFPPSPLSNVVPNSSHPNHPVPLPARRSDSTRENLKPVPLNNRNTNRRGKMKALVRRITSRQNLDRIDELDETDPFGSSYHHDGPYEAIGSNLAQPTLPSTYSNITPPRGIKFDPRQHQSPSRASARGEMDLSLRLQPGQVLRRNNIYTSHTSSAPSVSSPSRRKPDPVAIDIPPDISQSQSPPNPWTRTPEPPSTSPILLDEHQHQFSHAPRVETISPDVPMADDPPLHHGPVAAPYVLHQTETTAFPPPRHQSRLHSLDPLLSHTSPFKPASRRTQSTESAIPATRPHDFRHKTVHSLDTSHSTKVAMTQSPSIVQNRPPVPPRVRHLPKRLVMPAPLQPQPPVPQHVFPSAGPASWGDDHSDDHDLEDAHFEGRPTMYNEEPRLLRKRSSAFPAKVPIPDHAPMSPDDATSATGNPLTKVAKEPEVPKEKARRRKLSKRKYDI